MIRWPDHSMIPVIWCDFCQTCRWPRVYPPVYRFIICGKCESVPLMWFPAYWYVRVIERVTGWMYKYSK